MLDTSAVGLDACTVLMVDMCLRGCVCMGHFILCQGCGRREGDCGPCVTQVTVMVSSGDRDMT